MSEECQKNAIHICFVAGTIFPVLTDADIPIVGGAQVQQTILARELRARGYRVSVLADDHGVPDSATREGIEIYHMPKQAGRGIKGLRFLHPRLTDVVCRLQAINPDVTYFQCAGGVLAACAWYTRRAGKKLIFAAASDADFYAPGRIFGVRGTDYWLYRYGLKRSDAVIVQNQQQQHLLLKRYRINGTLIPNYYSERNFATGSDNGPVIWVGTISRIKRPEMFLSLAAELPSRRFVMVGGPSGRTREAMEFYDQIESRARRLPNTEFTGYVPFSKVGPKFDGASTLVNTSEFEGLPNVFLQAWIRGIPTLSFVAPSTGDAPTGTIQCRDLSDMSQKLSQLLEKPLNWSQASLRAQLHFARCHSAAAVMPKYEAVFSNLLAELTLPAW